MRNKYFIFIPIICLIITTPVFAQNTWEVTVSNYSFSPSELNIDQGDIVTWKNISGMHNVNGNISTFTNNPVSFGNEVSSAPWEYSFTFNVSGEYQYQCDPHLSQMQGTISVNQATSIHNNNNLNEVKLYPSPFYNSLNVSLPDNHNYITLKLFSLTGMEVYTTTVKDKKAVHLDLAYLAKGIYLYQLTSTIDAVKMGKIQKH